MNRALLLDRDGTLIVEKNYLRDPGLVELVPGAIATVDRFRAAGYVIVVLTNQSGVARGYLSEADIAAVHRRILDLGVQVDRFFWCPHGPDDDCDCRKPRTGLALRAADAFDLDLSAGILVGDKLADLELGRAIGASTVLVRTGYGFETERTADLSGITVIDDLGCLELPG